MAKGAEAKVDVAKKIAAALGSDWIGEIDKKYYVWGHENGEKVQICLAMTCPKVPVGDIPTSIDFTEEETGDLNFENMSPKAVPFQKAEITDDEKKVVEELMIRLGL